MSQSVLLFPHICVKTCGLMPFAKKIALSETQIA